MRHRLELAHSAGTLLVQLILGRSLRERDGVGVLFECLAIIDSVPHRHRSFEALVPLFKTRYVTSLNSSDRERYEGL